MDETTPYLPAELSEEEKALATDVASRLQDPVCAAAFCIQILENLGDQRGADFINQYFYSRMAL
jgi:hypothetical protein